VASRRESRVISENNTFLYGHLGLPDSVSKGAFDEPRDVAQGAAPA
jgi:hypothetical protein